MKRVEYWVLTTMLVVSLGCTEGTRGGPGVQSQPDSQTNTTNKPVITDSKETFVMTTPVLSTTVKPGESKTASIGISRGSNFKDPVEISFTDLPSGVTVDPLKSTINAGDKELQVTINAKADAAPGEFNIVVKGHAASGGPDATNQLKVTVASR